MIGDARHPVGHHPVPAAALGGVERLVGGEVERAGRPGRASGACASPTLTETLMTSPTVRREAVRTDRVDDLLGAATGHLHRAAGHQHRHLVAAEPAHHVAAT